MSDGIEISWPGDFECPWCHVRYDDCDTYAFNVEKIKCHECNGIFYYKKLVKITYLIDKNKWNLLL